MEETFVHVRTMISMVLGLGMAQLLKNLVKLIDHPKITRAYWLHICWVFYVLLLLIHFWWWEARLQKIHSWNFSEYLLLIFYSTLYYALCVLIFPDRIVDDYKDYRDYFFSRRKWFFSFLVIIFLVDFADTLLKGKAYMQSLGWEYPVRNITHIICCLAGVFTANKKFHAVLVIAFLVYEISYILRWYYV